MGQEEATKCKGAIGSAECSFVGSEFSIYNMVIKYNFYYYVCSDSSFYDLLPPLIYMVMYSSSESFASAKISVSLIESNGLRTSLQSRIHCSRYHLIYALVEPLTRISETRGKAT